MGNTVISIEHITKKYNLGVIGTGTLSRDLNRWWARLRGQSDPYSTIGQRDHFERIGESILALDDVSFKVEQGEALGIIGKNGAGKSTLLKILSRVTAPTSGVVKVKGRIGSLLEVGTGFHPELTGRENVYLNGAILGMRKDEVDRKFDEIVDFSGVEKFIDTPVKRYSSGMYVRLAFAVAAHLDPEILVVDEVLAVGDAEFQKKCLGKMGDVAGEGRTVLFVSHNMASIENLCNKCILLKEGKKNYSGNPSDTINRYLQEEPLQSSKYSIEKFRKKSTEKIIEEIRILNGNRNETKKLRIDDEIIFEFKFNDKLLKIDNPYLGIGVNNWQGTRIFTLWSYDDKDWNDCHISECIIPKNKLMPGYYYLKIALFVKGIAKDIIDNFPGFEIISHDYFNNGKLPNRNQGVVIKDAFWEFRLDE